MSVGQNAGLPPTRLISWQQLVLDADPDWYPRYQRPWIYEWSNGRRHYQSLPYPNTILNSGLANDNGVLILQNPQAAWAYGVSPGGFYSNNGVVSINNNTSVGLSYSREAQSIFFNQGINDATLWSDVDSQWLPEADPLQYLQLWNNNGEVNISLWQVPAVGAALGNDGGVVTITIPQGAYWPTTAAGARANGFYSNGGAVTINGFMSYGYGEPVYFQHLDDVTLLLYVDAFGLPPFDPQTIGQLWNNGGELSISLWTKMGGQWIGSASFGGVGNSIITGFKLQSVVALGGAGILASAGSANAIASGIGVLGGAGNLVGTGVQIQSALATLSGGGGLSGFANAKLLGPASMGGTGAFVGAPRALGQMNGAGAVLPIENAIQSAIATPFGSGGLSGNGNEIQSAVATFSGNGGLT